MSEPYVDTYGDYVEAPYLGPPLPVVIRAAEPLPVEQRPTRTWAAGQITVPAGKSVQLVTPHPARARLVLAAVANAVNLGPVEQAAAFGLVLPADSTCEFGHREAVWAYAPTADTVVSYAAEYLDG